tara:strand:+ start:3231 stop:3824 length:594 start_codon:yes stop_codon:yes gene_type:complete
MTIQINGNGTITGIAVGGLPDGIVDTDMIAASAVTPAKSTITGGLSMVDQWRHNATNGESNGVLTNWERNDSTTFSQIGTGMTESSGVFTFPSTGIYRIDWQGPCKRTDNITIYYIHTMIEGSTDSGSNWSVLARSTHHIGGANNSHGMAFCTAIFDVTNVSTHRLRLNKDAQHPCEFQADTSEHRTGLTFMKLGET